MLHNRISIRTVSLFVLLLLGLLLHASVSPSHTAHAAPAAPVVDTLNDEDDGVCAVGDCSLREAIAAAAPGDTITFSVNGTIVLSSGLGELLIGKNLTIDGGETITVSGNNAVRVFKVTAGDVTFENLTIARGFFTGISIKCGLFTDKGGGGILNDGGNVTVKHSVLAYNRADCGGGILNDGALTVTQSFLIDNSADFGSGGAIDNRSSRTATITESELYYNTAIQNGGAINNNGAVNVTRSTISDNYATTWGGGVYSQGVVNVTNSTFSNNLASEGGGLHSYCSGDAAVNNSTFSKNRVTIAGGGIVSTGDGCTSATTTVANSIVSGNVISGTTTADDLALQSGTTSTFSSGGYNLIGTMGSGITFAGTGDQTNVTDPKLDPLADNGGATFTHALKSDSLAIDNGECSSGPATDQRGIARPQNDSCDIGAYEKEQQQPVAAFSGTPTSGTAPLAVSFSNQSTGNISTYAWDFGDGNSSTDPNPGHTYTTAGDYTVELTVSGPGGDDTETKTNYISVADAGQPPVAAFSGTPTSGTSPLEVDFSDASTGDISSHAWDFGDGNTSTETNPSHTYATAGDYTVELTVSGPGGDDSETKTNYISVANPAAPNPNFSGTPRTGATPLTVNFSDLSTGVITSRVWTFGDGGASTEVNPSHTYTAPGEYPVGLTVVGPGGSLTRLESPYISVVATKPTADFSGTPTSGNAPLDVNFNDLSSGDISSYAWDFGDGSTSTEANPNHTYTTAGVYTVSLTVTGPAGHDAKTQTRYINVIAPDVSLDMRADYLEVTQGIQDLNNGVRLVENKRTFVRFYAKVGNLYACAKLHVRHENGNEIELKPILGSTCPYWGGAPNREALSTTALFELPDGFREGKVIMTAEINSNKTFRESNYGNNYIEYEATFEEVPALDLVLYKVGYGDNVYPADIHGKKLVDWLERAYPVSKVNVIHRSVYFGKERPSLTVAADGVATGGGCIDVNDLLNSKRVWDANNNVDYSMDAHYYGLVDDSGGFMRGCARRPGYVGSGPAGDPAKIPDFKWDTDGSYADWYGGHELGHSYGRPHISINGKGPCGGGGGGDFPYPGGLISNGTDEVTTTLFGFDIHTKDVYSPRWSDVMSYCEYQWISDFTYEHIMDYMQFAVNFYAAPTSGSSPLTVNFADLSKGKVTGWSWDFGDGSPRSQVRDPIHTYTATGVYSVTLQIDSLYGQRTTGRRANFITVADPLNTSAANLRSPLNRANARVDRLLVIGTIDPATQATSLAPMFVLPDADDLESSAPGEYAIVLRDAGGAELARYAFTPDETESGPSPTDDPDFHVLSISELVPYVNGTTRVDIEGSGTVLTSVTAGAAAPSVTVTTPNGGETLAGDPVHVTWSASDPDGDALVFNVQYSTDGGQSWEMLAQFLTEQEVYIDAANIAGSNQSLFRVVASDGIHTAHDDSDSVFFVPNRIPTASILDPVDGATVVISQTVGLRGEAYDVDTGTMVSEQVQWSSDQDGVLGNGQQMSVASLSEGLHTITFRADDGKGGVAEDSVQITVVSDDTPLPDKLRAGPTTIIFDPDSGLTSSSLVIDNQGGQKAIGWAATTSEAWVQLGANAGTTPDTIDVTFIDSGLALGFHSAVITFTSPDTPGQSQDVNVAVTITGSEESGKIHLPVIMN